MNTLAGGVGFLPKESEYPKGSDLSVFLKKSSGEVPLKGSLSLNGSPNGSKTKHFFLNVQFDTKKTMN